MFEGFPYTNFHELNTDWIIKIAKDFLDQYTHIQEVISTGEESITNLTNTGLEQLQEKADNLEQLLQAWYDDHSEDIENQLRSALADIDTALNNAIAQFALSAEAKAQETIESIPADYSTVAQDVIQLKRALSVHSNTIKFSEMVTVPNKYIDNNTGLEVTDNTWSATGYIPLPENCFIIYPIFPTAGTSTDYNCFYDVNKTKIVNFYTDRKQFVPANAKYIRCSINSNQYDNIILKFITGDELTHNLENTITFQGGIGSIERLSDLSINISLRHNTNDNLGYFQPPTGVELYFNGRGGTQLSTHLYQYNIPRYDALVLDMSELYSSDGQMQAKVVQYADIKPYHIILARNCSDNDGLKITGILIIDNILKDVTSSRTANKDEVMRSICRMGDAYGLPETADAIQGAYNAGFNYIRVNLQFTSDGQAVLWHDPYLNQYYHNVYDANGDLVPYSTEDRIKISDTPLATLNQYRYGRANAPTGIPTLASALQMARKIGAKLYLETKMTLSSGNINSLLILLYRFGMLENVTLCTDDFDVAVLLSTRNPQIRIGLMAEFLTENMQTAFASIIANGNPVMWWGYKSTSITNDMVYFLTGKISYEVGDFQTINQVGNYLNNNNAWVCKGMEMEGFVNPLIGQYIESL